MRIERVLVPIDFSPASTVAVNCAVVFAREFRASLTLLHVLDSRAPDGDRANQKLTALVGPEDQDDLNLQTVIKRGSAEENIRSTIREQHADLVVMGTHSRRFLDRLFIGSVTVGVLRHIEVPILTVSQAARPLRFERILFATDLSERSMSAFDSVLDLAQTKKSNVTLLHTLPIAVVPVDALPMGAYVPPDYTEDARAQLDDLVAKGTQRSVKVESVVVEGIPADAILKTAQDKMIDLIVITAEHRSLLERALLGSTTERVIRESDIPVLSIPKEAQARLGQRPAT
jgi:nucleotide-binding universal stress UspA family protein